MIISYSRNFIFMHSRKTAGSTITAALNRYLGPKDIQIGAWSDAIAAGGHLNDAAKKIAFAHYKEILSESITYSIKNRKISFSPSALNRVIRRHYYNRGLFGGAHSSAYDVSTFDPDHWKRSFKFCFVRNPWIHAVSDYYWRCFSQNVKHISFKEFLFRLEDPDRPDPEGLRPPIITNWSIYTINGACALDYIGRYENLDAELRIIEEKIGVKINLSQIRSKGNVRAKDRPVESYYDDEAIELVRKIYRSEIEEFQYQPFVK